MHFVGQILEAKLPDDQVVAFRSRADCEILRREFAPAGTVFFRGGIGVRASDCILDVGATIGMFLLRLNGLVRKATVHCFEPIPETFEVLRRNADHKDRLGASLWNIGVAAADREVTLTHYPRTSVASTMCPSDTPDHRRASRRFVFEELRSWDGPLGWCMRRIPAFVAALLTEAIRRSYQTPMHMAC